MCETETHFMQQWTGQALNYFFHEGLDPWSPLVKSATMKTECSLNIS